MKFIIPATFLEVSAMRLVMPDIYSRMFFCCLKGVVGYKKYIKIKNGFILLILCLCEIIICVYL